MKLANPRGYEPATGGAAASFTCTSSLPYFIMSERMNGRWAGGIMGEAVSWDMCELVSWIMPGEGLASELDHGCGVYMQVGLWMKGAHPGKIMGKG